MYQYVYHGSGQKLLSFLQSNISLISYNTLQKLLRTKNIKVNGVRQKENVLLQDADIIQVYGVSQPKINVIYSDKNICIADKPAGIETAEADVTDFGSSLQNLLSNQLGENLFAVHRLDRNTSGLIIFAKTQAALAELIRAIKSGKIKKIYYAVVVGKPRQNEARLTAYEQKQPNAGMVNISQTPKPGYIKILTNYKLVKTNGILSLLKVELVTGKTHQIRAHLASVNLPVLGDIKYGNKVANKKYKKSRQLLLSAHIKFDNIGGDLIYLNLKEFNLPFDRLIEDLNF